MWATNHWYAPVGDAVYPAEANVWYGTGQYGPTGTDYTPSKRASSIANCEAGNVKSGVQIDNVTGTYAGSGGGGGSLVNGGLVH